MLPREILLTAAGEATMAVQADATIRAAHDPGIGSEQFDLEMVMALAARVDGNRLPVELNGLSVEPATIGAEDAEDGDFVSSVIAAHAVEDP